MGDNLFEGLPPPSHEHQDPQPQAKEKNGASTTTATASYREVSPIAAAAATPAPVLKSAMKRPKPVEAKPQSDQEDTAPGKRLRFKTTTDASEKQVIEAMQKIASHIKNQTKFSKASKLAIQLIQAGSVKAGTSDEFFAILATAMSSTTPCTDPSVRADCQALFSAAQDAAEYFNQKQKHQLATWTIRAVVANDLFTDDSFVFSKTATRVKEAIANLPVATEDEDLEEATSLQDETAGTPDGGGKKEGVAPGIQEEEHKEEDETAGTPDGGGKKEGVAPGIQEEEHKEESDPFGLDALIPSSGRKDEKAKGKKDAVSKLKKEEQEETKRYLKSQRKALITCLEIAARRYKLPWCQTVIDILVKHAFDNVARFTSRQRDAIGKLWASIREQQARRKQGKSVNGKLDVNGFEWLQEKYANEKISIRRAVGGTGDRRASQWLG